MKPGVSVLGVSCVLLCLCYYWAWLSWGEEMWTLVRFDCAYSCAHHNCVTNITCACLCCTSARAFFKCKKYSLVVLSCDLLWISLNSPVRICFGCESQSLLGCQIMALKHGIRCNVTPIMNNVHTRMQEPQICSSVLHSQPVFHLLLEALERGWNLDHLDIPVAWMFSLQRASIHCYSLTKNHHQHNTWLVLC